MKSSIDKEVNGEFALEILRVPLFELIAEPAAVIYARVARNTLPAALFVVLGGNAGVLKQAEEADRVGRGPC